MQRLTKVILSMGLAIATIVSYAIPAQVIIIRHAEKPDSGNDLSPRGYERASALAPFFQYSNSIKPDAVYAQAIDAGHASLRPIETCTPTANALQLPLNSEYGEGDYANMTQNIMNDPALQGKIVLICWSHDVIPEIATSFGVKSAPPKWSSKVYDQMYLINFDTQTGKVASFSIAPQELLYGDSKNAS